MTVEASPGAGAAPLVPIERLVHDAVQAVPGVARLSGGRLAEYATYLPGERIPGVRFADDVLHVHVVLRPVGDLRTTAASVHDVVGQVLVAAGTTPVPPVHVHVDDVELAPAEEPTSAAPTGKERT
ncbi:hypothetical protein [Antribacter gilvus]|uniref:hypothetical protein n=1 Tax=Antribacter gilvus TaxID=2304675 RepID=UPI000F76F692|nr:hypothetical protein [Antribacter gilvus]